MLCSKSERGRFLTFTVLQDHWAQVKYSMGSGWAFQRAGRFVNAGLPWHALTTPPPEGGSLPAGDKVLTLS